MDTKSRTLRNRRVNLARSLPLACAGEIDASWIITARLHSMQKPSPDRPILKKGHNCWRIAPAKRAAVLIDGANYYAQLDKVIRGAQKSILIIGWDFDAGVKLLPEQPDYPKLGDLLRSLVEERPLLEVRVLVWSVAVLHSFTHDPRRASPSLRPGLSFR